MSEEVWIAVVQWLVGPLTLLIVGWFLNRKIQETRKEITNSHPKHLRDDLDSKFELVFAKLDTLTSEQENMDRKFDKHAKDMSVVYSSLADHESRLTGQAGKLRRVSAKK
jgi:hypothetical protein